MLQVSRFCIVLIVLTSTSSAIEFLQPTEVLSQASESCVIAVTINSEVLIREIQFLDDVSFRDELSVRFGVVNMGTFVWPNGKELFVKNNARPTKDLELLLFAKIKVDHTCLLIPDIVKLPDVYAYTGYYSRDAVVDFINNYCHTYREPDGSRSINGIARDELLQNLFQVKHITDIKMSDIFRNNVHNVEYCKKNAKECSKHNESLLNGEKYQRFPDVIVKQCDKIQMPSKGEFIDKYLKKSKPVIIQAATSNWKGFQKWTNDFLREKYGKEVIHIKLTPRGEFEGVEAVSLWDDFGKFVIPDAVKDKLKFLDLVVVRPATLNMKFSEFLDMVESVANGSVKNLSAYMEYTSLKEYMSELVDDIEEMPFFRNVLRLEHLNIWLSDGNTIGKTHFDQFDNFLCMISGKKQVTLFDPNDNTLLYEAHIPEAILSYNHTLGKFRRQTLLDSTSMVMSPVDILKPDFKRFPKFSYAHPMSCTIEEGEVLYIPAFWWHEVQSYPNVKEGRNLAVNFWYDPFLTKEFPCAECKMDINPNYRHLL